jgi:peptidoglycan biosynthesis protein MviN/MurJ (putative lipid II flippase)
MNIFSLSLLTIGACLISIVAAIIDRKRKQDKLSKKTYRIFTIILGIFLALIVFAMIYWYIMPLANYEG